MSVTGLGGVRGGSSDFDGVAHPSGTVASAAGAGAGAAAVVRGGSGPARPDPSRAATDAHLRSLDAGLAAFKAYDSAGATPKARAALEACEKQVKVRLFNMAIDDGEKAKAAETMRPLGNREWLWVTRQMGWTMQSGGAVKGGWAESRFLFEPKFVGETNRRLAAVEAEFKATVRDPIALQFCLDQLKTERTQVWNK